jgi:cellulose biosynthesis protein BcsQ
MLPAVWTTVSNRGVLLARQPGRVLLVDADPQFALTRQLGIEERSVGVNLLDVLIILDQATVERLTRRGRRGAQSDVSAPDTRVER